MRLRRGAEWERGWGEEWDGVVGVRQWEKEEKEEKKQNEDEAN